MKFTHFVPDGDATISVFPTISKTEIPKWYIDGESNIFENGHKHPGLKRCIPFLDALTSGYLLKTSANIYITKNSDGTIAINYDETLEDGKPLIHERKGKIGNTIPRPEGHLENHLIWTPVWGWKTPKNYSSLIIHPLNRFDLPFTTLSGIIDSDKFFSAGNIPFFLKESFEGLIPKGTPFAQIIPIKRKKWNAVIDPSLTNFAQEVSTFFGVNGQYKKKLWQKKHYSIGEKNGKQ
jgi:hypothetical protein